MIYRLLALLCATVLFLPPVGAVSLGLDSDSEVGGFRIKITDQGVQFLDDHEEGHEHNNQNGNAQAHNDHDGHHHGEKVHHIDDNTYLRVAIIAALKNGKKLKIKYRHGKTWIVVPYEYQISYDGREYLLVSHVYYKNGNYHSGATLLHVNKIRKIKLID